MLLVTARRSLFSSFALLPLLTGRVIHYLSLAERLWNKIGEVDDEDTKKGGQLQPPIFQVTLARRATSIQPGPTPQSVTRLYNDCFPHQ